MVDDDSGHLAAARGSTTNITVHFHSGSLTIVVLVRTQVVQYYTLMVEEGSGGHLARF